jgi:hypothetical protein
MYNIYKEHSLITEGRFAYANIFSSYTKEALVDLVKPMIENIAGESVIYEHRYKLCKGKVLRVKKDLVVIFDSHYRRRISIKNVMIYHPSIIAMLKLLAA